MPDTSLPDLQRLPIFPLNSALFPRGKMNLTIFEARYMEMVARCMQTETTFGICLIMEGQETGLAAVPHRIGTEARIVDWDMGQPGVLKLTVRGGRRFELLEHVTGEQQLITGVVRWLNDTPQPVSDEQQSLLPLLQAVAADAGNRFSLPYDFADAAWVGFRYAEILPIPPLARQRLLELDDAELRLSIIREYLLEHGLIK